MARGEVRPGYEDVVARAVQATRATVGSQSLPAMATMKEVTTLAYDANGDVLSLHDFMVGVDAVGDNEAPLAAP